MYSAHGASNIFIDHPLIQQWVDDVVNSMPGTLYFPRMLFLVPILGLVNMEAQINFILFFKAVMMQS